MRLKKNILFALAVAALVCGCDRGRTYSASAVFAERARLTEATENFVKVSVALETDSEARPIIRATFTPTEAGLHLYGIDMPEEGIKGFGRPTRLEVMGNIMKSSGPVFADVAPQDLDVGDVKLPVYPEGPVTLRQPVKISSGDNHMAEILVSYMACRTGGECRAPVEKKRLALKLPNQ